MIRNILYYPNSMLTKKTERIDKIDKHIQDLAQDLIDTCEACCGIGLSANQVGVPLSMVLLYIEEPIILINPEIVDKSKETILEKEKCISFPGLKIKQIKRHKKIKVKAKTTDNNLIIVSFKNIHARIIQRTIDYINGLTFLDRLTPAQYLLSSSKIKKYLKNSNR